MSDREFWTWCVLAAVMVVGPVLMAGCYAVAYYYLGNW